MANSTETGTAYDELTPLQQELVDLAVEHPDWTNRKIAAEATKGSGDGANESYVSEVLNEHRQLIRERRQQRYTDATDPYQSLDPQPDVQTIDERPEMMAESGDETVIEGAVSTRIQPADIEIDDALVVEFSAEEIEQMLRHREVPDTLYERIVREVVLRAFGDGQ